MKLPKQFAKPKLHTDKKILVLGETYSPEDQNHQRPFSGASGELLSDRLFPSAELDLGHCYLGSVFSYSPPNNDFKLWTGTKTDYKKLGIPAPGGQISKRYLLPQYWNEVKITQDFIKALAPDLIICLGAVAQWCLIQDSRIGLFRGTKFSYKLGDVSGIAISTYSPAAVLRQWDFVPTVWADLTKARHIINKTENPPVPRRLYYSPTEDELQYVYDQFISTPDVTIGVDIETAPAIDQITCIGFGTPHLAVCIPFWDKETGEIYPDISDEVRMWRWAEKFCKLPHAKVLHNGMYDMQYMLDAPLPLRMSGSIEDTLIRSHAMQPELPKSLGHLASVYTNEPSWKQMRTSDKDAKAND